MPESVTYYYPGIDRRGAVALLRTQGSPRSYLIRDSQSVPGSFVLSFRIDPFVRNFTIIKQDREGEIVYRIGNRQFSSISAVIEHYKTTPLSGDCCIGDPVVAPDTLAQIQQYNKLYSLSVIKEYNGKDLTGAPSANDQSPPSPIEKTGQSGTITTHSTRIRCYDYPSVVLRKPPQSKACAPPPPPRPSRPNSSGSPVLPRSNNNIRISPPRPTHPPPLPPRLPNSTKVFQAIPTPPPYKTPLFPSSPTQHLHQPFLGTPLLGSTTNSGLREDDSTMIAFSVLMEDPSSREQFVEWLEMECMEENILFLTSCERFKLAVEEAIRNGESLRGEQALRQAQDISHNIFIEFMTPASMYEVDISVATVKAARIALDQAGNCSHMDRAERLLGVFDDAYRQIYEMLGKHFYPRYLQGSKSLSPVKTKN